MDQPNPTFAKIPILDIGKFEQWKFKIQQYLQNEHYALWEVIEFGDSYEAPQKESGTGSASESSAKKKGRTVADIVSHLEFMDVEIEQDDLNQKFLTILAPECLMYTIVWRNRGDLDTMSLDDLYNHLKVYEPKVQKKSESNSHNMAFISSTKNRSGKGEVNTASIPIARTYVSPASADVAAASISHDTMDIKWNMALLSMRADRFWKKTGKKIIIQGVEEKSTNKAPKPLIAIDGVGWDWSYMANEEGNHAFVADEEAPTEFALMAKSSLSFENEDTVMFPPPAQVYSPPMKDMSWTGLPELADDTITDYSRPPPSIESNSGDLQNTDSLTVIKTNKVETIRKSSIRYAEMYRNTSKSPKGNSQNIIDDKGYWDSGCSWHMTGNISYLSDYEPYDGGYVSFRQGGGKITDKGIIKTDKLEFENVYFVKDLKDNLFSVSQICDNKNNVLFTDSEYIVLGRDFKVKVDTNVLLRTPRQHNMYSIDLNNIVPLKDLTCLVAKASADESMLWHRRLGHLNFKTMNKLGKQHKASCKTKLVNSVSKPLHTLHMDLFGPTSVSSLNRTKDAASQDVKKDVSSLRYIALPNWFHEAHLESSTSNAQDACNADAPKSSGNSNPTATSTNPSADQMEKLTMESAIHTVSSLVLTACLDDSPKPSSTTRLISKRVTSQDETPSL
nr:hypothetical protein [Tanacetum cinerariifolium]